MPRIMVGTPQTSHGGSGVTEARDERSLMLWRCLVKRLVTTMIVVIALGALLPAAAAGAPPPATNPNGGEVVLTCEDGTEVSIWVNFVASDRSGENPALVVTGTDARVFKLVSYQLGDDPTVYPARFPAPPAFHVATCTHPLVLPDGQEITVTLTGVFIP